MWTKTIWIKIGPSSGPFDEDCQASDSTKAENLSSSWATTYILKEKLYRLWQ
jgi:hypothetical protein